MLGIIGILLGINKNNVLYRRELDIAIKSALATMISLCCCLFNNCQESSGRHIAHHVVQKQM